MYFKIKPTLNLFSLVIMSAFAIVLSKVCVCVCVSRPWWTGTRWIRRCWQMSRWTPVVAPGDPGPWWSRSCWLSGSSGPPTTPRSYSCSICSCVCTDVRTEWKLQCNQPPWGSCHHLPLSADESVPVLPALYSWNQQPLGKSPVSGQKSCVIGPDTPICRPLVDSKRK